MWRTSAYIDINAWEAGMAERIAREAYRGGEIVLSSEDCVGTQMAVRG